MAKIRFKNLMLVILAVICLTAFSGCGKKDGDNLRSPLNPPLQKGETVDSGEQVGDVATGTSTDEINTSDWKIYRNEEYGFELMYPEGWGIDSNRSSLNEIVFNMKEFPGREAIKFNKNIDNIGYNKMKEQKIKFYELVIIDTSELVIDGEKAIKIETSEMGTTKICFLHNNFIYEITTGGRMEEIVLNTFQFID